MFALAATVGLLFALLVVGLNAAVTNALLRARDDGCGMMSTLSVSESGRLMMGEMAVKTSAPASETALDGMSAMRLPDEALREPESALAVNADGSLAASATVVSVEKTAGDGGAIR